MNPKFDVAVIGGGIAGISAINAFVKEAMESGKKVRIVLIDKQKEISGGLPWHKDQSHICLSNAQAYGLTLDKDQEFLAWAYRHPKIAESHGVKVTKIGNGYHIDRPYFPRALFGAYCAEKLKNIVRIAKSFEIEVSVVSGENVVDLQKQNEQWEITLQNKNTIQSDKLVLATGDISPDSIAELEKEELYYASPYSLVTDKDLTKIPPKARIAIIGTSLSAMDTVRLFKAQNHEGPILMTSRTGGIPVVKAKVSRPYRLKYLTPQALEEIKPITLQTVLDLFCQEVSYSLGKDGQRFDLTAYLNKRAQTDHKTFIQAEIEEVKKGNYRDWQPMLDEVYYEILPFLPSRLSPSEYTTFMKEYYRPFMLHGAGFPLENAEILKEKLCGGSLIVVKGFEKVEKKDNQFQIIADGKVYNVDVVINAIGGSKKIQNNPLLARLEKRGLVSQHTEGGINIDVSSYQVIGPEGKSDQSFYAVGAITFGSCPNPYDVFSLVKAGRVIGKNIIKSISAEDRLTRSTSIHRFFKHAVVQREAYSQFPYLDLATPPRNRGQVFGN